MSFNPLDHPIIFTEPNNIEFSAWTQHIPIAMFLVDVLRPSVFVELGVHYGVSYCAFCQAVKTLQLNSKCYGVDAWLGDEHAGEMGQEVLQTVRTYHDPAYNGFSRLLEMTFDAASEAFDDDTIDLLHIDGLHTYEAVKHDYDTWFPKLSNRAVVLFHDINVRENNFGVWKLWDELKAQYPHFEFVHQHGLGILAVGEDYPKALDVLVQEKSEQCVRMIREFFFSIGRRIQTDGSIAQLRQVYEQKYAAQLEAEVATRIQVVEDEFNQREQRLQQQQEQLLQQQEELRKDFQNQKQELVSEHRIQLANVKAKLGAERDKLYAELTQRYNKQLSQKPVVQVQKSDVSSTTRLRWKIINRVAPKNTTRRRIYNLTKASAATLVREGPFALAKRGGRWLRGDRRYGGKKAS